MFQTFREPEKKEDGSLVGINCHRDNVTRISKQRTYQRTSQITGKMRKGKYQRREL